MKGSQSRLSRRNVLSYPFVAIAFCIFTFWHFQADASIITFTDKAAFLASTGATSATGDLPNLGAIPGGVVTVGSITFSTVGLGSGTLFVGGLGTGCCDPWTTRLPGNQIAIGHENLDANVASGGLVFSLGFDFVEPNADIVGDTNRSGAGGVFDSTFEVTLRNSGVFVGSFTFNAPDDTAAFVGVWGDTPFNQASIRDITGTEDDEYFGQFYTGTTSVPAPGTLGLIASGMIGLATALRRRICCTGQNRVGPTQSYDVTTQDRGRVRKKAGTDHE